MLTKNLQVTEPDLIRRRQVRRKGLRKFLWFNSPALFWMTLLFIMLLLPSSNFSGNTLLSGDKIIHLILFFVQVVLLMQGFYKQQFFPYLRYEAGFYAVLTGFILSGLTEIAQGLLVESRSTDPYDYLANSIGCLLGWAFFSWVILPKRT